MRYGAPAFMGVASDPSAKQKEEGLQFYKLFSTWFSNYKPQFSPDITA
jgi:hypothetical protein